jgi:hypothetical protein
MGAQREVNLKLYKNGIPKDLPDHVTLTDVVKSMPKEVKDLMRLFNQ